MNYKHESGLIFSTERLVNSDENMTYDISVVCLWLPKDKSDTMIIVNWYYGDPDDKDLVKGIADVFCNSKTSEEIEALIAHQLEEDWR